MHHVFSTTDVIPAKAGIQASAGAGGEMDSGLRRNDTEFGAAIVGTKTEVPAFAGMARWLVETFDDR